MSCSAAKRDSNWYFMAFTDFLGALEPSGEKKCRRERRRAKNILPINNKFLLPLLDLQPGEGKAKIHFLLRCYGLLRLDLRFGISNTRHVAQKRQNISYLSSFVALDDGAQFSYFLPVWRISRVFFFVLRLFYRHVFKAIRKKSPTSELGANLVEHLNTFSLALQSMSVGQEPIQLNSK